MFNYYESKLRKRGFRNITGIDEVGLGSLAGPVVCAAVILPFDFRLNGLRDSKRLSSKKREEFFRIIRKKAKAISWAMVSEKTIDQVGLVKAKEKVIKKTLAKLVPSSYFLLLDGQGSFSFSYPFKFIIKGDEKVRSIACASIVAKVIRDRIMVKLSKFFPQYNFAENKGYGTKEHRQAIKKFGPCPLHRRSFIKNIWPVSY